MNINPTPVSASSARCGKIARLPIHIRDQVNRRLENNEPAGAILLWLNSLAETKQILTQFQNIPISPQNLSEWRQGGHREWLVRRELIAEAESLHEAAGQIKGGLQPQALADNLAIVLAARYAALLNNWDGSVTPEFENQLRILRTLNHDILQLQKSLHRAAAQNFKLKAQQEDRRQAEADREHNLKVLTMRAKLDVDHWTRVSGEVRGPLLAATRNNVTLEDMDLFCGPPSQPIKPNQTSFTTPPAQPAPFAA